MVPANPKPVSLRARLLRPVIRLTIGRAMRSRGDFPAQRRQLLRAAWPLRWVPAGGADTGWTRLADLPTLRIVPRQGDSGLRVLYLHGGGYAVGAPALYRSMGVRLARLTGATVLIPDYRLAPEHRFPAAVDDALAAYRALLAEGTPPGRLVIAGDSAGGGLALACALAARDAGLPMPAGLVGLSPWTDLSASGASLQRNRHRDLVLDATLTGRYIEAYLGRADRRTALASPLFADLSGLPPLLLQASADESLLDDSTRLAAAAEAAGVPVQLDVWHGVWHVWQALPTLLPEADTALLDVAWFIRRVVHA